MSGEISARVESEVEASVLPSLDLEAKTKVSSVSTSAPTIVEDTPVEPSSELIAKILKQVEFYFGDANLQHDRFLLKHVRSSQEGWVSVGLITSFRKMQQLNVNPFQVTVALRQSTKLVVNQDGSKVRRSDPLPVWDDTVNSKSILVTNFKQSQASIAQLISFFEQLGFPVVLVRIIQPGKPLPPDLRLFSTSQPALSVQLCAVVEFAAIDAAQNAAQSCADPSVATDFTVCLLGTDPVRPPAKTGKAVGRNRKSNDSTDKKKSPGRPSPPTPPVNSRAELLRLSVPGSRSSSMAGSPKENRKSAEKSASPVTRSPTNSPKPLSRQIVRDRLPTSEANTSPRVVHIRQPLGPNPATTGFLQRPKDADMALTAPETITHSNEALPTKLTSSDVVAVSA